MPVSILMPALSPTMEEGKLSKWLVKEGDEIAAGDVIAEIETDKATMEVEAVDEGVIGKLLVAEGTEGVKVNTPIALLLEDGEDTRAVAATVPHAAELPPQGTPNLVPPPTSAPAAEVIAPQPRMNGAAQDGGERRLFATPLARRLAAEKGIDLHALAGSGPYGRIIKADVEAAATAGRTSAAPLSASTHQTPALVPSSNAPAEISQSSEADAKIRALFEPGSYTELPHDGMRKTIARRLVEAKSTIPHFYLSADCELDELLAMRKDLNARAPQADGKPAYKISVNDFVIKALGVALMRVPEANVTWTEGAMLTHHSADVGVAVAITGGLITPIIRKAHSKGLQTISEEMKDFADRARARKLKPQEYQGGSSAVSNLGMYGVSNFSAVINPPHATILAVGAGKSRPVIRDGEVATATVMSVTLSCDHRAVDGAVGAELLAAFKGLIEDPIALML